MWWIFGNGSEKVEVVFDFKVQDDRSPYKCESVHISPAHTSIWGVSTSKTKDLPFSSRLAKFASRFLWLFRWSPTGFSPDGSLISGTHQGAEDPTQADLNLWCLSIVLLEVPMMLSWFVSYRFLPKNKRHAKYLAQTFLVDPVAAAASVKSDLIRQANS